MREILFRGKRTDNGEWVCGSPIFQDGYVLIRFWNSEEFEFEEYLVAPESVSEYTGLTDKNGTKIFEGDTVKFTDSPFGFSYTGVVCFNEGSFCIKYEYWKKEEFHRIGQTDKYQEMGASGIVTYQYEVLGNIHDNPELLKEMG